MPKEASIKSTVAKCSRLLKANSSQKTAQACKKYFKDVVKFRGLKAPQVDKVYQEVKREVELDSWTTEKCFCVGIELLGSEFHEEKRMGILFLKNIATQIDSDLFNRLELAFDKSVYDWATCDTLCGAVLKKVLEQDESIVPRMIDWSKSENQWRRRASCVSFLKFAKEGKHVDTIEQICDESVKMNERFVQLGVGWLLREFSLHDRPRVVAFLKDHHQYISREGLRYSLEKFPAGLKKEMMDYHKEQNSKS